MYSRLPMPGALGVVRGLVLGWGRECRAGVFQGREGGTGVDPQEWGEEGRSRGEGVRD